MKTIGRILIILAVFSIVAGLMVTAVNASSASAASSGSTRQFRPDRQNGFRPEREGGGAGGWMFGLVKNVGVMAVLVTLVTWPKSIAKKKKRQITVNSTVVES
jgi:hypothetical protein